MHPLQMYYNQKWATIYEGHRMTEAKPMPKYLCHKEVRALKIKDVQRREGKYFISFVDESYPPIEVHETWVDRFGPTRGSYYVVYNDAYSSISPAKAFEEGYTLVNEDQRFGPKEG